MGGWFKVGRNQNPWEDESLSTVCSVGWWRLEDRSVTPLVIDSWIFGLGCVPASRMRNPTNIPEHPIWTSQYPSTHFSRTLMAISRYLASRIRAQSQGTTIHVVGRTSTGWIDRGSFDLPALCFSRAWGCLTATPTRHDSNWGHRKPKSDEFQRFIGNLQA